MHTSPSDPGALCKDLWVVCTGNARACLSARTKSPSHVWVHAALGVCTFRVHAARVWVQGAPCARVPARGRSGTHARLQEPRGADPLPAPGRGLRRLAARCFSAITPPSLHPRTPAPPQPPARPRSPLSPAVSARPRRAALRSHWLGAPLCGGSCGPSAFECREGPGREPFHGPSVSPPAAAPPPPAPRAPPPAPAAPAAPPPPAPAPRSRATKGPRAAAAAAAAARGARMVLVHVGYLVLPVFGSVRNRGIAFCFRGPLPSVDRRGHRGGGWSRGRRVGGGGGGAFRAHPGGRGASGGFSPLPSGGTPSVEVAALVGAFAVKLGFWRIRVPSLPGPIFFILCGGRGSPSHSPFPQYLALCDRRTERDT